MSANEEKGLKKAKQKTDQTTDFPEEQAREVDFVEDIIFQFINFYYKTHFIIKL